MTGISWSLLAQQPAQDPKAGMLQMVGMIAIMGFMFYFALWRPQQKKAKEQEALIKALKAGDKVITSSGICGVIVSVKDKSASLRSADSKLEVLKSAITQVIERSESDSHN
jgi:preprotein translocase subunit YajC